jgi:RNA polymerase sigma-70 factor (ECF subfamily)
VNQDTLLNPGLGEAALVQRAQQGDREALTELFERLHQPLLNYLYHMLGQRQAAEDITQDAFIRAFEHLDQLGPPWDFKSWLYRIASNLAVDQIRREKRYMDKDEDFLDQPTPTHRPIERNVEREEGRRAIWKTLEALPTSYRQALILKDLNNFSYQEIAQALACSYANARQIVHRSRLRFRDLHRLGLALAISRPRCQALDDMISAFHNGEVSEEERRAVEDHVKLCEECRDTRDAMSKISLMLAGMPPFLPSQVWKTHVIEQIWNRLLAPSDMMSQQSTTTEITQQHPRFRGNYSSRTISRPEHASQKSIRDAGKGSSITKGLARPWMWIVAFAAIPIIGMFAIVAGVFFKHISNHFLVLPSPAAISSPLPVIGVITEPSIPTPTFTMTPSATMTLSPTFTPTGTPTITPSSTPTIPLATLIQNANCRQGPGKDYAVVTSLLKSQSVEIDGRNQGNTWWWIRLPNSRAHCWVSAALVITSGNVNKQPVIAAPDLQIPTDTPVQGCWVYMANLQKNICTIPCPPNAKPGGVCTPK